MHAVVCIVYIVFMHETIYISWRALKWNSRLWLLRATVILPACWCYYSVLKAILAVILATVNRQQMCEALHNVNGFKIGQNVFNIDECYSQGSNFINYTRARQDFSFINGWFPKSIFKWCYWKTGWKLTHTQTSWVGNLNLLITIPLGYFHSHESLIFNVLT